MKVSTGVKSGSAVDSAWQFVVDTGDNIVGFVKDAEVQATDLTQSVFTAADNLWQGFVGLFR
jgi:hypothetical protein